MVDGYEIFFVDETFFDGQDQIQTAWSPLKTNVIVPQTSRDRKRVGVIGAFSYNTGSSVIHIN